MIPCVRGTQAPHLFSQTQTPPLEEVSSRPRPLLAVRGECSVIIQRPFLSQTHARVCPTALPLP